jgi:hypothetical protein
MCYASASCNGQAGRAVCSACDSQGPEERSPPRKAWSVTAHVLVEKEVMPSPVKGRGGERKALGSAPVSARPWLLASRAEDVGEPRQRREVLPAGRRGTLAHNLPLSGVGSRTGRGHSL